jgi:two-component system, cell cycle sensor histidine kinase and response regulator CckA
LGKGSDGGMSRRRVGAAVAQSHERWNTGTGSADSAVLPLASLRDLPVAVIVAQDGMIVGCSDAAARLLGTDDAAGLVGQLLARFLDAAARVRIREAVEGQPGAAGLPPLLIRRADGDRLDATVCALPLRLGNRPALQLVLQQWPGRTDAEPADVLPSDEQLRQAQRMNAVGRLAAGIAHDFNNILTAIRGHVTMLLEELPEGSGIREDALDIERAAERATDLTRQLLTFARGRRGQPVPVDMNHIVIDVGRLMRRLIAIGVDLRTDLQPDLPLVIADPGQLQQIVLNLVVNASEAIEQDGTIVVGTRALRLPEASPDMDMPPGDYVQLLVSDTGPGIGDDARQQIFEPFFTTKPQGTGLGLSTVYGIVRKCGGSVRVSSEDGCGATFEVILPADVQPQP